MLIDLHVHSNISRCSSLSVAEILDNARACGLDGVCITDHDTTEVLSQIDEGFQSDGLLVIVGMEYTTAQGDFLVFGPVENLPFGLSAPSLLKTVRQAGGTTIAAHPFRGWRPTDISVVAKDSCSIVEVENGRNSDYENVLAAALAHRQGLVSVAGSDAHNLAELGQLPTRFTVPIAGRDDLVQALNQGQCMPALTRRTLASAS